MSAFTSILALVGPSEDAAPASPPFRDGGTTQPSAQSNAERVSSERVASMQLPASSAQRSLIALSAMIGALVLVSLWGLAVNPVAIGTSLRNASTVPMLLLVSALVCLPAIVVFMRIFVYAPGRVSSLFLSYGLGAFAGSLTMAALAPVIALYYHSSHAAGPLVAKISVVVGLAVGTMIFTRVSARLAKPETTSSLVAIGTRWLTAALLVTGQLAVIAQLASTVDPILDHRTRFGQGIDGAASFDEAKERPHQAPSEGGASQ